MMSCQEIKNILLDSLLKNNKKMLLPIHLHELIPETIENESMLMILIEHFSINLSIELDKKVN